MLRSVRRRAGGHRSAPSKQAGWARRGSSTIQEIPVNGVFRRHSEPGNTRMIKDGVRMATVSANEDTIVMSLDRSTFVLLELRVPLPFAQRGSSRSSLKRRSCLQVGPPASIRRVLIDCMLLKIIPFGAPILNK